MKMETDVIGEGQIERLWVDGLKRKEKERKIDTYTNHTDR